MAAAAAFFAACPSGCHSSPAVKSPAAPGGARGITCGPKPKPMPYWARAAKAQPDARAAPRAEASDDVADSFGPGKMRARGSLVHKESFSIHSYDVGSDLTASVDIIMNHLLETALKHTMSADLRFDGFGCTPEMTRRGLAWVIASARVHVERYPSWGDEIDVETWAGALGRNGVRRFWHVRDGKTGHVIARATSVSVMMNKRTRRLSKIPKEVKDEIWFLFNELISADVLDEKNTTLPKLDDKDACSIREGLTPRRGDIDANQHMNSVKYVAWILESVPSSIKEKKHLTDITLEYRRECTRDSRVQSRTLVKHEDTLDKGRVECNHLLCLDDGTEIVRSRTVWMPKSSLIPSRSLIPKLNGIGNSNS